MTADDTAYANWLAEGRRRGWLAKADALAEAVETAFYAAIPRAQRTLEARRFVRAALAAYRDEERP